MTFHARVAERRLKDTARLVHQGMWLLFPIAAGLLITVRRQVPARTGSIWILGCAVLACMLLFVLRDVVRKARRRSAEDKIVNDLKTYLAASEPASPAGGVASRPAGSSH